MHPHFGGKSKTWRMMATKLVLDIEPTTYLPEGRSMGLEVTLERGFFEGKSCSLSLKFNGGPSSKPPRKLGLSAPELPGM